MKSVTRRNKPLGGVSDPRHGTVNGYNYWGCRCEPCRTANSAASKSQRSPDLVKNHGRVGYDYGCRCEQCRSGKRQAQQALAIARKQWRDMHSKGTPKKIMLRDLA